jgi:hypothetical protein
MKYLDACRLFRSTIIKAQQHHRSKKDHEAAASWSFYFLLRFDIVIAWVFIHSHHGLFLLSLIKELQGQGYHLGEILGLALILIFIGLQAAFEKNETALLEIFLADLSEPSPGFDVDPLGRFFRLAAFVLPRSVERGLVWA